MEELCRHLLDSRSTLGPAQCILACCVSDCAFEWANNPIKGNLKAFFPHQDHGDRCCKSQRQSYAAQARNYSFCTTIRSGVSYSLVPLQPDHAYRSCNLLQLSLMKYVETSVEWPTVQYFHDLFNRFCSRPVQSFVQKTKLRIL